MLSENNTSDIEDYEVGNHHPYVILVVGVNGVGKTTTIGKLAYQYSLKGKKVMIAAGDTFRDDRKSTTNLVRKSSVSIFH